ncbi:SGNH/GDSL hydrolase family protein [Janibacter sp. GS2]|uniref:SGNH/GDSL hydrolase family protein n=1 Tax=Janibacter sp. GS2 TaxID=3442646 RepID=UPI003EB75DE4
MARTGARNSSAIAVAAVLALLLVVGALWTLVFVDFRAAAEGGGASASRSASPSPSSSSPTQAKGEWTLGDARTAFARDDSHTLVLGDSTGNATDEWVHQWAQSEELPVASWQTESESGYDVDFEETRVWSGAMFEATADYPAEHWDEIWPPEDPDLVMLNYGHFQDSPEEATQALEELRADIAERAPKAPIVVILQNPQAEDANAPTREAIAEWAKDKGLPTIDIAQAFEESELLPEDLRLDNLNPSWAGSQLWAQTVSEALAPR